jgi:hypothetical protein
VALTCGQAAHEAVSSRSPRSGRGSRLCSGDLADIEEENATLRAIADERREDFVDRADMSELLKATSDLMPAKEAGGEA